MEENKKPFEQHNTGKEELSVLNTYLDRINHYEHEKNLLVYF